MISDIEIYFEKGCGRCKRFSTPDCSTQKWMDGLQILRQICLEAGLIETVKWGHPCYTHSDRNIAIFGAFRNDFRITFLNAALLKDSKNVLEKQGPNSTQSNSMRFTDSAQTLKMKPTIKAYLQESMAYAEQGIKAPKQARVIELPDELIEALDSDPAYSEAFHNLTPGRQRSYIISLNSAKKTDTKIARIDKFRDKVLAGKGATER